LKETFQRPDNQLKVIARKVPLGRGLRQPPRLTTRSVEVVSRTILQRAGGNSLEISVSRLIDTAMVFRYVMPRTYHRMRKRW